MMDNSPPIALRFYAYRVVIEKINHLMHDHLLKFLLFVHALAIFFPFVGVFIKNANFGTFRGLPNDDFHISLPMIMLSFLLFNAGLSVKLSNLKKIFSVPLPLFVGLLSKLLVPLGFCFAFALFGQLFWDDAEEIQIVLVGLAIIASMPIAGSSTAWVQNANGNAALILGLVVVSTFLCPFLSPLIFHALGSITQGDYSAALHQLANRSTSSFLVIAVVVPALAGMAARWRLPEEKWLKIAPTLKMLNLLNLLMLNYANAAVSLPTAFENWKADFVTMIVLAIMILCVLSFLSGWLIPRLLRIPRDEKIALAFGVGMNNNGTGLVLAAAYMGDSPLVMLPIIFYNLGQQIMAGIFASRIAKSQ